MTAFFVIIRGVILNMIEKRFNELYNRAYERGYTVFSEFLNLEEQSILEGSYLPCFKFGGYAMAERVVAAFGDDAENTVFPIAILQISPSNEKFSDSLTHRDFLGGLMNLGIKRELLGDILVSGNTAYVFCLEQIKDYILRNLTRIKHTTVKVTALAELPATAVNEPRYAELIVPSLRLDAVISSVYKLSRKDSCNLIKSDRVFMNSRQIKNTSCLIKQEDIISVRGMGRFKFIGQLRTTKKDRIVISVNIY